MFVGSAISAIGVLIPIIGKIASNAGKKASMYWIWLTAILIGIAILVTGVMHIAKAIKNNSIDARME
jgi:hypothetical protein